MYITYNNFFDNQPFKKIIDDSTNDTGLDGSGRLQIKSGHMHLVLHI